MSFKFPNKTQAWGQAAPGYRSPQMTLGRRLWPLHILYALILLVLDNFFLLYYIFEYACK